MIYRYFLLFIMYSFLGWLMEVIISLYNQHKFINRGFLIGPYCPIYGFGCLLITQLLKNYTNDFIVLFTMAIVICSLLEYFTSYFMEKLFHARWWDYSQNKFNLNGRICLETMIPFGILGCVVMYVINPFFNRMIDTLSPINLQIISIIVFIIFIIDNIVSFKVMNILKNASFTIRKDSTEEITKKVKEILTKKNFFTKRLIEAFPNLEVFKKITTEKLNKTKKEIKKAKQEVKKLQKDIKKKEKIINKK